MLRSAVYRFKNLLAVAKPERTVSLTPRQRHFFAQHQCSSSR
jgi:hypothetical protein